jgi:PKD repeat protein
LPVTFTDQSSNSPTEWLWDFGDGWTSPEQHPSHVYNVPGIYTVALSVSNPAGSDTETKPNHVTASGLLAAFSATTVQGTAPLTVSFTDQSAGIPGLTGWAWDFGDGGSSTEQHPEYTYTTTGTFSVTLTVANGEGSDSLTVPGYITVNEEKQIYLPLVMRNAP